MSRRDFAEFEKRGDVRPGAKVDPSRDACLFEAGPRGLAAVQYVEKTTRRADMEGFSAIARPERDAARLATLLPTVPMVVLRPLGRLVAFKVGAPWAHRAPA